MKDALIVSVLSVVPRNRGARTMGWLARSRASRAMTRLFVRAYGVDLNEAEGSLQDYPTLAQLFTRKLKPGIRPVASAPIVSPVDGRVAAVGLTEGGCIDVAPGRALDIAELLQEELHGERDVAVLYLSPKDYHRVHVPVDGAVTRWNYLPGTLWPVFPAAVRKVDGLFSRNERLAIHIETASGPVAAVMVGAFGVGRITTSFCDVVTNTGTHLAHEGTPTAPVPVKRGDELGVFHLGSTVVLVVPPGQLRWTIEAGEVVRVGQAIAHVPAQLTSGAPEA